MIKIWHRPHVAFAATILQENLSKLGFAACQIERIDPYDPSLYIVYGAVKPKRLPANYILYQTEVAGTRWFSRDYQQTIAGAIAVWEYDAANIVEYQHLNPRIQIVTPGVKPQPQATKNTPVLFYGCMKHSPRRRHYLREVGKAVNIAIVTDKMTDEMWRILARTQTVLNLHYYEHAPLETFRIHEALSFGCKVVSESSHTVMPKYRQFVQFADGVEQIIESLLCSQGSGAAIDLSALDNLAEVERAMQRSIRLKPARKRRALSLFNGN